MLADFFFPLFTSIICPGTKIIICGDCPFMAYVIARGSSKQRGRDSESNATCVCNTEGYGENREHTVDVSETTAAWHSVS